MSVIVVDGLSAQVVVLGKKMGVRKLMNKKNDFQIYLIKSDIYMKGISYGDVYSYNYFELNKEPENNQLLKISYDEIKKSSKMLYAEDIYFFTKLKWSKAKLKKFVKTTDKKLVFHEDLFSNTHLFYKHHNLSR